MSVDILPPKFAQMPTAFNYPGMHMREAPRAMPADAHIRRKLEDVNNKININHFDPNYIIYDATTDTTYLRGRVLGKVSYLLFFGHFCRIFFLGGGVQPPL